MLEKCTLDPKHKNPKLESLRQMIVDYFKENPDSRVIVFAKTRELVKAIESFMKETEELRILNPIQFVGVQANKEMGGLYNLTNHNFGGGMLCIQSVHKDIVNNTVKIM